MRQVFILCTLLYSHPKLQQQMEVISAQVISSLFWNPFSVAEPANC